MPLQVAPLAALYCTRCKNAAYLLDGVCVTADQCQATGGSLGNTGGNFGRICDPRPGNATPSDSPAPPAFEFQVTGPTPTSDRVCAAVSVCPAATFQTSPPSATADRSCQALRPPCSGAEFQAQAPTTTSDRVCRPLTVCQATTEYEAQAATASSDRRCAACTPCPTGSRATTACAGSADTVCSPCRVCLAGSEWQATPCTTAGADATCRTCTRCVAGETYAALACGPNADTVCRACSRCAAQQYATHPCTAAADTTCSPLTTCGADQLEVAAPTATSDRRCGPRPQCAVGQYAAAIPGGEDPSRDFVCRPLRQCNSLCSAGVSVTGPCACQQHCHTCINSKRQPYCTLCSGGRYLYQGECLLACTGIAGFEPRGTDALGRVCAPLDASVFLPPLVSLEYETVAATASTDRTCVAVRECEFDEYQDTPPTPFADRVCATVSM